VGVLPSPFLSWWVMEASFQGQSGLFAAMTQPQLTCQVFDGPWPVPRPAHQVRDLGDVLSERLARREYRLRALTELNIPAVEVVGIAVGCVVAAAGFALWAGKVTDLHAGSQVINIVIAGAGMGLLGRPTRTRRTGRPGFPTVRPPASPRPSATTVRVSGSPSWARS
jgi:hypothetical protein